MNRDRDFDGIAREWLDDGSDWTPPHVIDAVLLAVRTTPQERDLRISWRTLFMKKPMYAAAVIAFLAVAGAAAFYAFVPRSGVGSGPTPIPSVQGTTAPSPTVTPGDAPIDTTSWTTYQSERYSFAIGHPPDWTVTPADHDWTLEADADDWLSTGQDMFTSPDGHVRVSAWAVPVDADQEMWVDSPAESWANVAAWVEDYCQAAGTPCEGVIDRAVPLCLERRDCHPGLLVPFPEDVQAFFTNGGAGADMVVVAIWRGRSSPAVASYGGSQRLLEGFLATMCVWPADALPPFEEEIAGC